MSEFLDSEKFSKNFDKAWYPIRKSAETKTEFFDHFYQRVAAHPIDWIVNLGWAESESLITKLLQLKAALKESQEKTVEALFKEIPRLSGKSKSAALTLKRKINDYQGGGAFPELAIPSASEFLEETTDSLRHLGNIARSLEEARAQFAESYETYLSAARSNLLKVLGEPLVLDSVLLSSHSLYEALRRYVSKPPAAGISLSKSQRQFEGGFYKFLARACTKSSPRGLVAGVSPLEWTADETKQAGAKNDSGDAPIKRKRVLLNLPTARALAKLITAEPELAMHVIPRQNPTLHREGDDWSLMVPSDLQNESMLALPGQPVLDAMIEHSARRSLTAEQLISKVHAEFSETYSESEIKKYYGSLCEKNLLIGYLEIPAECEDALSFLRDWLERFDAGKEGAVGRWVSIVSRLSDSLSSIARSTNHADTYRHFQETKAILAEVLPEDESPLVVDCVIEADTKRIDKAVLEELEKAVRLESAFFRMITNGEPRSHGGLEYVMRRLKISNEDWKDDLLPFWKLFPFALQETDWWADHDSVKAERYLFPKGELLKERFHAWRESIRRPDGTLPHVIDLEKDGAADFFSEVPLSESKLGAGVGALQFSICARSLKEIQDGNYQIVLEKVDGWGLNLAPRFLSLLEDQAFADEFSETFKWLAKRRHEGKVPAELLCYTGKKIDTWTKNPSIFSHCIELAGARSNRLKELVIPIEELWLRRSSSGKGQLVWRSDEGEKAVQPFFFAMVDESYINSPSKVLIPLGERRDDNLNFHLAMNRLRIFGGEGHTPRITYGKLILQRETWFFPLWEHTLDAIVGDASLDWEAFFDLNAWRLGMAMPRFVFVVIPGERRFYLDFLCFLSVQEFFSTYVVGRKRKTKHGGIKFTEMWPDPSHQWQTTGSDRRHVAELVEGFRWP